jgi:two-component system chemotaxis sensor kinase CheA
MEMSRYLGLFLSEAREHLESARDRVRELRRDPADATALQELFRHAHSLKGMAATMGFRPMIGLAHALEDLLEAVRSGRSLPPSVLERLPGEVLECLARMVGSAGRGEGPDDPRATELTRALRDALRGSEREPALAPGTTGRGRAARRGGDNGGSRDAWVRVRADLLDALLECTLEMVLERGRLDLGGDVEPGESLRRFERCDVLLKKQYELVTELRLVPFERAADRLARAVAELAGDLGKQAELTVRGRDVRLDRSLLDGLVEPLLHLLRNAVDHGIEFPAERTTAGKPDTGRIELDLERRGDAYQVVLRDDGVGMDPAEIVRTAIERKLVTEEEAARLDESELCMLVTLPGFSTAREADTLSGRGVGMDVVRRSIESMGGHLAIHSESGRGTEMRLTLPRTLAMIQALLLRCRGELYAVPLSAVQQTVELDGPGATARVALGERPLDLVELGARLGIEPDPAERRRRPRRALLLDSDGERIGLLVEEVLGRREIVVRPLEPPLSRLGEFAGASLLDDGDVALVLDPAGLARPR